VVCRIDPPAGIKMSSLQQVAEGHRARSPIDYHNFWMGLFLSLLCLYSFHGVIGKVIDSKFAFVIINNVRTMAQ
jgi:hypothetical protein